LDYEQLILSENEKQSEGDLFYYILDPSEKKSSIIQSIADSYNLTPFTILPRYQAENRTKENVKKNTEDCVFPSVTKWLRAFLDAKIVVADSFHGTVFSILFNKPFWAISNSERGNARFDSLLGLFGLKGRLINSSDEIPNDWDAPIDWDTVNKIIEEERNKSLRVLKDALS
jgi:hypothetical protein